MVPLPRHITDIPYLVWRDQHSDLTLTLKVKQPVILPAKWVNLGISENCNLIQAKALRKSSKQRRGVLFYSKKEEVRSRCFEQRSPWRIARFQGGDGFPLADFGQFPLAGLVAGVGGRNLPSSGWGSKEGTPSGWECKVRFFLLGSVTEWSGSV